MIHVIATINLKPGTRTAFLDKLHAIVPKVLAENGCHGYVPTVDFDSGLEVQEPLRENTVVIVEAWENMDCLNAHLIVAHMTAYRETVKDMVESTTLQIQETA